MEHCISVSVAQVNGRSADDEPTDNTGLAGERCQMQGCLREAN